MRGHPSSPFQPQRGHDIRFGQSTSYYKRPQIPATESGGATSSGKHRRRRCVRIQPVVYAVPCARCTGGRFLTPFISLRGARTCPERPPSALVDGHARACHNAIPFKMKRTVFLECFSLWEGRSKYHIIFGVNLFTTMSPRCATVNGSSLLAQRNAKAMSDVAYRLGNEHSQAKLQDTYQAERRM